MTLDEATRLVLREGFAIDGGILLKLRMAEQPAHDQFAALFEALEFIRDDLRGRSTIDGKLAYALFGLAFHAVGHFDAWARLGRKSRPDLGEDVMRLAECVEEIFLGVAGDVSEFG